MVLSPKKFKLGIIHDICNIDIKGAVKKSPNEN